MLNRLTTKNFRKLTDHTFEFGPGLQVVRGPNEAGKSTMFEAVGYALFGAKACREELAAVVTWGQPERSLKVTLLLEYGGVPYMIARSPAGAEITWPVYAEESMKGGRVVGQKECTAFMERLLGADAATLPRLMLASQGEIRGALGSGSKATMQLIESLANFDVIDSVIELIQTHRVTGPTVTAEDRVKRAQEVVEAAEAAAVAPDIAALHAAVVEHDRAIAHNQKEAADWAPRHDAVKTKLVLAEKHASERETLRAAITGHHKFIADQKVARSKAEEILLTAPPEGQVEDLQHELEAAVNAESIRAAHSKVKALMSHYPAEHWEGDAKSLADAITFAYSELGVLRGVITIAEDEMRRAQLEGAATGDTCSKCKQALPNAAEIQKHRAEAQGRVELRQTEIKLLTKKVAEKQVDLNSLLAVQAGTRAYDEAAFAYPKLVAADFGFVPTKLTWTAELPSAGNVDSLQKQLANVRRRENAAVVADAQIVALGKSIERTQDSIGEANSLIADLTEADKLPAIREEFEQVASEYNRRVNDIAEHRFAKQKAEGKLAALQAAHAQAMRGVEAAKEAAKKAQADLDTLHFSNNLLKRVRSARPLIADKLWAIVLAAVSSYFSAMRGTKSVVTRAHNAFHVDGKAIDGLSGSTLDILGLAIRMALTRTFLPTAPFLILDEPAAACDDERATSLLGFLVTAGFPQTLLVTHEETSEAVAQNVICLESAGA